MNDDGYSDVIISANGADKAYVFYGAPTFSSSIYSIDEISGSQGFVIYTGNDGDELIVNGAGVGTMTREIIAFTFHEQRYSPRRLPQNTFYRRPREELL